VVCGCNDNAIRILDVERKRMIACVEGHADDINAVAFVNSNVVLSGALSLRALAPSRLCWVGSWRWGFGRWWVLHLPLMLCLERVGAIELMLMWAAAAGSDDTLVKVWDLRCLRTQASAAPAGVLAGHTEGVTHLTDRGGSAYSPVWAWSQQQRCRPACVLVRHTYS
jgi:hypothetical protein